MGARKSRREARFDARFFARYYLDPATRVADPEDDERLAVLVAGITGYLELPVRRILDAGCGVGLLRRPLLRAFRRARYVGLDASAYLARRYGHVQGSIADYRPATPFDLVICRDVLQYLDDDAAARSIANLARLTRAALYLSVPTRADFADIADPALSDANVSKRSASWYQSRLRRHFRHLGFGVYLKRSLAPVSWQLEEPWR
jgi:SAM-dependent methyltransferase